MVKLPQNLKRIRISPEHGDGMLLCRPPPHAVTFATSEAR